MFLINDRLNMPTQHKLDWLPHEWNLYKYKSMQVFCIDIQLS